MEPKKISFGFMKTKKADKPIVEEKKEFIECLEGQSIKVVGGQEKEEKVDLIIPMKPNTLVTAERLKQIAEEVESAVQNPIEKENSKSLGTEKITGNESLDQMAVRELLEDSKKESKVEVQNFVVPLPTLPILSGEKESTLDDYESVPIQDFGLAMLRGMGWTPGKEQLKYKEPQLRPKGLGLGADKVIKPKQNKSNSKEENDLNIVKNAYVKINTGKYAGCYGKVISLDEDNGRVMVDITVKKETVSLSEFMMQPVTKAEYDKEAKVINADKYEEYKKKEQVSHKGKPDSSKSYEKQSSSKSNEGQKDSNGRQENYTHTKNAYDTKHYSKNRDRDSRRNSSSENERSRRKKKDKKRYSSNDSLSSLSDSNDRKRSIKKRYSSVESSSSDSYTKKKQKKNKKYRSKTPDGKRDIDKKRKGKKKKRDRDRSPNYKKHRK